MRTAIYCVALAIIITGSNEIPDDIYEAFAWLFLFFVVLDFFELFVKSNH